MIDDVDNNARMGWMGGPTASSFGAAAVLWFVIAFGPGYLLATAVDPWRSLLDRVAVAPLLSFGIAFPLAAWAGAVGAPGSIWWAPVGLASRASVPPSPWRDEPGARHERGAHVAARRRTRIAIVGAVAVAVTAWLVALSLSTTGLGSVVPGTDGAIHGMVVTDMLRSGSMFSPLVGRYDLGSAGPACRRGTTGPADPVVPVRPACARGAHRHRHLGSVGAAGATDDPSVHLCGPRNRRAGAPDVGRRTSARRGFRSRGARPGLPVRLHVLGPRPR